MIYAAALRPAATIIDISPRSESILSLNHLCASRFIVGAPSSIIYGMPEFASFDEEVDVDDISLSKDSLLVVNPTEPVEFHHFPVQVDSATPDVIQPLMRKLTPWLFCAVKRAFRSPGSPSCAALSRGWSVTLATSSPRGSSDTWWSAPYVAVPRASPLDDSLAFPGGFAVVQRPVNRSLGPLQARVRSPLHSPGDSETTASYA